MKKLVLSMFLVLGVSCSDAGRAKIFGFGQARSIVCYSGGKMIYKGNSTGKINSEQQSDGYYFKEQGTGKLIEVSGNCILGR